jgi:hypothetical protein
MVRNGAPAPFQCAVHIDDLETLGGLTSRPTQRIRGGASRSGAYSRLARDRSAAADDPPGEHAMAAGKGSGEESLREITDQELAQLDEAMVAAWHAGTLREFFSERHPEWSEEEIERWTVKAEAYFGAQMN